MRRFLMRQKEILQWRAIAREDRPHLSFDRWKVFRVPGLDQHRGRRTGNQKSSIVRMKDFALEVLLQAFAEPVDTGCNLTREWSTQCTHLRIPRGT